MTKYRRRIFNEGIFAYIDDKLAEVSQHYPEVVFERVNHDKDHIHLLISIAPTMREGIIKKNTSSELKEKFPFLKYVYRGSETVWSEGYFASRIGLNEETIYRVSREN